MENLVDIQRFMNTGALNIAYISDYDNNRRLNEELVQLNLKLTKVFFSSVADDIVSTRVEGPPQIHL
jgi:hypothetical protein